MAATIHIREKRPAPTSPAVAPILTQGSDIFSTEMRLEGALVKAEEGKLRSATNSTHRNIYGYRGDDIGISEGVFGGGDTDGPERKRFYTEVT
jgi:hypothetical protein